LKKKNQIVPVTSKLIQRVSNVLSITEKILGETSLSVQGNTFTDPRDGQVYKTVRLKDGKIWMAQNLNFDVGEDCWFYDDDPENGKKYGRLYTWEAAKRACPPGWHIPSDDEWWEMAKHYGMAEYYDAGEKKNSDADAGKAAYKSLLGGGDSGFSALLGGSRWTSGDFSSLGSSGGYWSSSEQSSSNAWNYNFSSSFKYLYRYNSYKSWGFSCRCVQD